jgi:hypothetical protein
MRLPQQMHALRVTYRSTWHAAAIAVLTAQCIACTEPSVFQLLEGTTVTAVVQPV